MFEQEVWDVLTADLARLGLGEQVAVSAEHGDGLVDIHDVLLPLALQGAAEETRKVTVTGMLYAVFEMLCRKMFRLLVCLAVCLRLDCPPLYFPRPVAHCPKGEPFYHFFQS